MMTVIERTNDEIIVKMDRNAIIELENAGILIDETFSTYEISFSPGMPAEKLLAAFDK